MKKRILAVLLVLSMVLSSIPFGAIPVFATGNKEAQIMVESKHSADNTIVEVEISVKNNPGVAGAKLQISYDSRLVLLEASNGEAFSELDYTEPAIINPCYLNWDSLDSVANNDGVIATLKFNVPDNIEAGEVLEILCSYEPGHIYDTELNDIEFEIVNGGVTIIDYIPGDANSDGIISGKDVTVIRRYNAGFTVDIDEAAADVNEDNIISGKDVTLIRRFNAGYDVVLKPSIPKCQHSMIATHAKEHSCTEDGNIAYWYCEDCNKYFSDEDGKTEIAIEDTVVVASHTITYYEAKAASETVTGCIAHWYCSACEKYFANSSATQELAKEDVIIPMLVREESTVIYNVYGSDPYLESVGVDNSMNPSKFYSVDGLVLNDIVAPAGYVFKGWTTAAGAPVTEIAPSSSSRQIVLNATWSKVEYTVTFDSPDVPVEAIKYTVDTGTTFKNASWYGYTFVGWSNNKGELLQNVKPGTTGNMTLHANWTSNRNRAKAVTELGAPIIIENMDDGQYLFVYEIGTIENVPLSVIEYIGNSQGITINKEYEYSKSVQEGFADTIAKSVSNATVKTSAWTLSEDWNSAASATNEHEEEKGKTNETTDSQGNVTDGKYYISNVEGGSTAVSSSFGGSSGSSSKVAINNSVGINGSYTNESESSETRKQSVDLSIGAEAKAGFATVKADAKYSQGKETTESDKTAVSVSNSREKNIGVEGSLSNESHWDSSKTNSSSWNTETGYEIGESISKNSSISNVISEAINDRFSYSSTEERGGSNSSTHSTDESQELTNEYASTVEYSSEVSETTKKSITYYSDATGYYRLVNASTVHVFAVVGYDIATNSYFTYTYNVLDKERHEYLDYSKDNANFNDCENAILPFEVPYEVHEITTSIVASSDGLVVDTKDGVITDYTSDAEYVLIPEYVSVDNEDGTYSAVRIRGIETAAFKSDTSIKGISLPKYVTQIPNNAFDGCTSLETIMGYGIVEIGAEAFKGCINLETFAIDQYITTLGENAFFGVDEITVVAANEEVVSATLNSGAKKITLNISKLDAPLTNKKLEVSSETAYFALISDGSVYNNLQLVSHAEETFLSNFALVACKDTPLEIGSEKLTLNRIVVQDAPGFALVLTSESTDVKLFGNNELSAKGDNAVLCKDINLSLLNSSISSKMIVSGDMLCCGTVEGASLLTINDGEVREISAQEFNQYRSSIIVAFNSNGGFEVAQENIAYYGQTYGELPIPMRDNHGFVGWFTEADGGTQITADSVVSALVNQTLYAHWAPNQFTVTYNANGGDVSTATKALAFGDSLGDLPIPTRTHYSFEGWYTEVEGGTKVSADTIPASSDNITVYAHWTIIPYKATWSEGSGYTITVNRTSSPNANASMGVLSSEATVYYGDVLSISYAASTGYTLTGKGWENITVTGDITSSDIFASVKVNSYTVSWNTGTGYSITVKRTSSPKAGAATGALSNGAKIYYGDVLSVTYTASTGYTLGNKGSASITVTGNVTSSTIYTSATANSYKYNIVYKSSNGTSLGSSTATYKYGTTNTISPKTFSGYTTPSSQSVKWDSTSAKTITFTYSPKSVATSQNVANGTWWYIDGAPRITYAVKVEYRNRTANSVQIRFVWTNTLVKSYYFSDTQTFYASAAGVGTGDVVIVPYGTWSSWTTSSRSETAYSGWITVPVTAGQQTVSIAADYWDAALGKYSWSSTMSIPTY